MKKQMSCALAALALTGCASITGNKLQPLTVTTVQDNQEIAGVACTLSNDAGTWFVTTPGTATVNKSTAAMTIDCRRDTLAGNSRIESSANANVWGNVLLGGGIGYIVDRQTGAGFDYPNSTVVTMRLVGAAPAPAQPVASATAAPAEQPGRTVAAPY
jgi:hypothetical protein